MTEAERRPAEERAANWTELQGGVGMVGHVHRGLGDGAQGHTHARRR